MNNRGSFGQWLKKSRRALDLTQEQLADRVGVAPDYVRKLEKDARRPSVPIAERLAEYFGVPADQLPDIVRLARLRPALEAATLRVTPPEEQRTLEPPPPYNLPEWPTPFIGRRTLVEQVSTPLLNKEVRLLTLVGPPGIGKTRLSSEVAKSVLSDFPDGAYMVRLSPVSDPDQVLPAIAGELGVKEVSNRPALDVLKDYLREKRLLLVLDNFEQIVSAGPQVAELIQACPGLEVLVSSRSPLHVYGEHEFDMPPMSMPDPQAPTSLEAMGTYEAIELFVRRAQAVNHRFGLTDENYSTVAEICRQLDGLPLAIELAAARIKVLTPRQLLDRLTNKLKLLTTGAQDLPDRQRTLRGAIDWSYELLEPAEKRLFARMSVFVGGGTLEAVEAACALPGEQELDALDGIESLLDNCLLKRDDKGEDPSFWMLWTIREYAQERLEESREAETIKRQHAAYFLALAEQAEPKLTSGHRDVWMARLDDGYNNMSMALEWCLSDRGDHGMGLRLAGALLWYWYFRGRYNEGLRWLDAALSLNGDSRQTAEDAKALRAFGILSGAWEWSPASYDVVLPMLEESATLSRQIGDKGGLAYALANLGHAMAQRGQQSGISLIEESVALLREIGDKWGQAHALDRLATAETWLNDFQRAAVLNHESLNLFRELRDNWGIAMELGALGRIALMQGDYAAASFWLEQGLEVEKDLNDKWLMAQSTRNLGDAAQCQGNYVRAAAFYEESLSLYRERGDKLRTATLLRSLGHAVRQMNDLTRAEGLYEESLTLFRELERPTGVVWNLAGWSSLARAHGLWQQAVRLAGAVEALRLALAVVTLPTDLVEYELNVSALHDLLDEVTFAAAWNEGQTMTLEQAVAYVYEIMAQI